MCSAFAQRIFYFEVNFCQITEQAAVTTIAAMQITSQNINTPFHEEDELFKTLPATRLSAPQPIYADEFSNPPIVLTHPYFPKFRGTIVINITFAACIHVVIAAIQTKANVKLLVPIMRISAKNSIVTKKNTIDVFITFCSLRLIALAIYAPLTFTTGNTIVIRIEISVPKLNLSAKKVGIH